MSSFGDGIGNKENEERRIGERMAAVPEAVPSSARKSRLRFDPDAEAGVAAPANLG